MILLQLSAGQGPEECALAVAKALRRLLTEAEAARVEVRVLDEEAGTQRGTLRSVLLALQGDAEASARHRDLATSLAHRFAPAWVRFTQKE